MAGSRPMTPAARQQQEHIGAARKRLVHLAGLARRTEVAERAILAHATEMLAKVDADLPKLRPRVHTDTEAADRYQELTMERGRLLHIIAQARKALGEG